MAKSTYFVPKKSDAQLISFFKDAARIFESSELSVHVSGEVSGWQLAVDSVDAERAWIEGSNLRSILIISVSVRNARILIDRRPEQLKEIAADHSLHDVLIFNTEQDRQNPGSKPPLTSAQVRQINELIHEAFGDDGQLSAAAFRDPKTFQTVLRSHQTIIERLQKMTLEVGEQAANTRRELDEEYFALKKQLEEQVATERLENLKSADEERQQLADRADELAARARELDDRNNTHVRRELFEKTRTLLADRFKKLVLTPQTTSARTPIHVGVAGSAIVFGILIYAFTSEALNVIARVDSSVTERILVIAKSATASLAFLGVISWYLRWMNRWFERLADSEFQLKQFELDITRAQWVVETAFEWKMSQQSPIPDQLLDNVSRNLFVNAEKDAAADMHPADYLASALLGKASNVKLAVPGAEIELGPKALKDAGK